MESGRGGRRGGNRSVWGVVSVLFVSLAVACVSPKVEVEIESSAARDLRAFETFDWLPMAILDDAIAGDGELADELSRRAFSAVVARGYRASSGAGAGTESTMTLQLSVRSEFVSKRMVSPDPDANFPVNRTVEEAVVALEGIDRKSGDVLWRGVARGVLPKRGNAIGHDREAVWLQTADALTARFPER